MLKKSNEPKKKRRRGRPPTLSREMILSHAAKWDLRTFSVRGLAARMRVSDASIHYYFGSREQLLGALVDTISGDFEPPEEHADWRVWLREFGYRVRRTLLAHPGSADYMLVAGPAAGRQYGIIERTLGILQSRGVGAQEACLIYATTVNFVLHHVQSEEAHAAKIAAAKSTARMTRTLQAPDAPDLPRLRTVLEAGWLADFDRMFDYGLEALLRGFES